VRHLPLTVMKNHQQFLLRCIELASTRLGFCAPNPAVGCVVVKNDKIIAEGFHFGCGYPHAEVDAINKLTETDLVDATLYVSLEPCCHYGRTPPCTVLIKKSGIKQVYFGFKDPNPIVAGKGQAELIHAGIACEQIESQEINHFYEAYAYWTLTKMPFVTAKLAMSADYKIALENKKPVKISGPECDELTHHYRLHSDAILTTTETIIHDDPQLNARIDQTVTPKNIYILDSQCRLPLTAQLFQTAKSITVFHAETADSVAISALEKNGARCILISKNNSTLDLKKCMEKIGFDGVHQLWVEAGATCFNSLLLQQLCNRVILYVSSKQLGESALSANIDIDRLLNTSDSVCKSTFGDDTVYIIDSTSFHGRINSNKNLQGGV